MLAAPHNDLITGRRDHPGGDLRMQQNALRVVGTPPVTVERN